MKALLLRLTHIHEEGPSKRKNLRVSLKSARKQLQPSHYLQGDLKRSLPKAGHPGKQHLFAVGLKKGTDQAKDKIQGKAGNVEFHEIRFVQAIGYIPSVSQDKIQPNSFCIKYAESESPTVYVRGAASFVHISKEDINLRNKTVRSQRKNLSKSYFKESAKEKQGQTSAAVKHKRVWSSFAKMKERDRVQLQRTKKQASHSMINIEKLDSCKIRPWKAFQDHENGLDEH